MTRKEAIAAIRAEIIRNGRTHHALRLYAENRIGFEVFHAVLREALSLHARKLALESNP